ncbi:MAG: 3-phosphoshikimate 1-carboxyvinyltransferase [Rhodospirillales bacterium]|nr:3-phosphoshikimate 1-carboxyvinyltransferase [Rhodospirillales bacterium]MCB9996097.1 3-phosphoshikimate 1-carboxyvinyltransferase [Rhodospirillales bacterium]
MKQIQPLSSAKAGALTGTIRVPGDKSMSHRALMFGLLAKEETIISGMLEGEDVLDTATAVRLLGGTVKAGDDGLWRVFGTGLGQIHEPDSLLDMGNSGTAARLLMGLIAGHPVSATFIGDASLTKRPMKRVIDPLTQMGAQVLGRKGGRLPLTIQGTGAVKPVTYESPVASAQVKSAILLAGLAANGTTTVIESAPTRDHTENMLRHFGVNVTTERTEDDRWAVSVQGGQMLRGCAVDIPADPSSAAFPVVAALLCEGSALRLPRIGINPRRTGLYDTLLEMGADIAFENKRTEAGEDVADLRVTYNGPLSGIDVPPERVPSMIDEFPVLAVAASCASGTTKMTGLAELRVKESDRLAKMAQGLAACGVNLEEGEDSLIIHGTGKPPAGGTLIDTALDHRIAMSFLVLGCAANDPVEIDDAAPINTSFPGFVDLMNELGAAIGAPDQDRPSLAL